jgi:hydroxymethylpyrimidine/phosphomethylpyrimidine kinase
MSVIVSVVAENTVRVIDVEDITPAMIAKQIDAVFEDVVVHAVKIGMLSHPSCMETVAEKLRQYRPEPVVIDPVMFAKNGFPLMPPEAISTLVSEIVPLAKLLTPNIPEAEALSGLKIVSIAEMEEAAKRIQALGAGNVLVKGGHRMEDALDLLYDGTDFYRFPGERINTKNTHGTGCTYSAAIASNLALGLALPSAVEQAKSYVTTAIRHSLAIGKGCGPTHHFYDLYRHGLQPRSDFREETE